MPLPLSPDQKRFILKNEGYDPDKFDIDDSGFAVERVASQVPTKAQPPLGSTKAPETTSALGAGGAHALAGIIPAMAGIAGGALAAAPFTGGGSLAAIPGAGIAALGSSLLAGFGAAYGAGALQNKALETIAPSAEEYLARSAAEHPIAATGGSLLASAPFFRPSLSNVRNAAVSLKDLGRNLKPADAANLLNVGLGSSIGGAQSLIEDLRAGKDVDYGKLALSTAGGALLNRPAPMLAKLPGPLAMHDVSGDLTYHPTGAPSLSESYRTVLRAKPDVAETAQQKQAEVETHIPGAELKPVIAQDYVHTGEVLPNETLPPKISSPEVIAAQEQRIIAAEDSAKAAELKATNDALAATNASRKADLDFLASEQARHEQLMAEAEQLSAGTDRFRAARPRENVDYKAPVEEQIPTGLPKTELPLKSTIRETQGPRLPFPTPEVKPPAPEGILSTADLGVKKPVPESPPVSMPVKDATFTSPKGESPTRFQKDESLVSDIDKDYMLPHATAEAYKKAGIAPARGVTRAMVEWLNKRYGLARDITFSADGGMFDAKGKPIRGSTLIRSALGEAQAKLNKGNATFDTPFHEMFHSFLDDLGMSNNARDKSLYINAMEAVGKADQSGIKPEYRGDNEEILATGVGHDAARELLETPSLRDTAKTILSRLKDKWGNATVADYRRILTNRMLYDAPYKGAMERGVGVNAAVVGNKTEAKNQPNEPLTADKSAEGFKNMREVVGGVVPKEVSKPTDTESLLTRRYDQSDTDVRRNKAVRNQPEETVTYQTKIPGIDLLGFKSRPEAIVDFDKKSSSVNETLPRWVVKQREEQIASGIKPIGYDRHQGEEGISSIRHQDAPDTLEKALDNPNTVRNSFNPMMLRAFAPAWDKVRLVNNEAGLAGHKFLFDASYYEGIANMAQETLKTRPLEEARAAVETMNRAFRDKTPFTPSNPSEQALSRAFTKYMELNHEVGGREGSITPSYIPHMPAREVIATLRNGGVEASKLRNDFIEYHSGEDSLTATMSPDEAKHFYEDYIGGLKGSPIFGLEFGALRKAEGLGLPDSWREKDPFKLLDAYGKRASRDISYFKNIQSNERVAAALGVPVEGKKVRVEGVEDISTRPEVEAALKLMSGDINYPQPIQTAAMKLVTNSVMGTGTGLRNTAQLVSNAAPYMQRVSDLNAFLAPFSDWKKNATKALETNSRNHNLNDFELGAVVSPDKAVNLIDKMSYLLRKLSLRDGLEQMNRTYVYGMGDYLARDNYVRAKSGDKGAKDFLNKFGEQAVDVESMLSKGATEEDFDRLAKSFVDRNEGTYDGRGLPKETFDGVMAPYLSLSRWSVEKFNVIQKDVLTPVIRDGNYLPFLLYTGASWLSASAIRELNKILSHKKSQDPTLSEVSAVPEAKMRDYANAIVATLQLGSYAGIASDFVKAGTDVSRGKYPSGQLNFPLADLIGSGVVSGLSDYSAAVDQGADRTESALALMQQLAKNHLQTYRYLYNNLNETGKTNTERSDKFRDLRTFEELSGKPVTNPTRSNELLDADLRKFKRTGDINEAAGELPALISAAVKKAAGDPFRLKQELKRIKANSYQTMPDPQDMPGDFMRYLGFLKRTQGDIAASDKLLDYMKQKSVNKAKASLVP